MASEHDRLYRALPGVGEVLDSRALTALTERYSRERLTEAVRTVLDRLRGQIREGTLDEAALADRLARMDLLIGEEIAAKGEPRLRRVVNATGVILQTNLGRAPLSEEAIQHVAETARGFCNLEFDLEAGHRNRRDDLVEDLVLDVLGLHRPEQGAVVVNNCAAATFLALNTLGAGGEVLVSRGELVEIGGGFRIPEILEKSGAVLREVGTTNKTRVADYAAALGPATRMILRVHRSNFEIRGFTEQPALEELVRLGREAGVPVFEDQGTGCLVDLAEVGIAAESSWRQAAGSGVSLVAASGDKLLGGPQCGLLVGERELIEGVRQNPLLRALRVDKLTYAALESTLLAYRQGREDTLPVVAMLRLSAEAVRVRCERWAGVLKSGQCEAEVVPTRSVVGGGTAPGASLPSFAVSLRCSGKSEGALAAELRRLEPPVVGRVHDGRVLLDLRTVPEADDPEVIRALQTATGGGQVTAAGSVRFGR